VQRTRAVLGTPDNPMSEAQVEEKARDLMEPILGRQRCADLVECVRKVETLADIGELLALTVPE
ncbi:MAG: MmgE/PrpD family protein, partial [Silicimonas sp.]|nr:MmgE/PrpD family protein [Silicimonas sp.]